MARLIIPTRNRPTSLQGVLTYLHTFYPGAEIIVADGSENSHARANQAVIAGLDGKLAIDYRAYPYDLAFFDRLLDVLQGESDRYFIMGSDDDFPMLDLFTEAEAFLDANSDHATALGAIIHLRLQSPHRMSARLGFARPIMDASVAERADNFGSWMFSTTYALTRRELLIERYKRARKLFLPRFYDYGVGLHDCAAGKIKAYPTLGFFGTRNYKHSYLRAESSLIFLRRANEVLELVDAIEADLKSLGGLGNATARQLAEDLIIRRIGELCGNPPFRQPGTGEPPQVLDPVVQAQCEMFDGMFVADGSSRAAFEARMLHISAAIFSATSSDDNKGEKKFYETLDGQAAGISAETDVPPEDHDEQDAPAARQGRRKGAGQNQPARRVAAIDPRTMLKIKRGPTA